MIQELEIARNFGASVFLIYQAVKMNPNSTQIDIQVETGLSQACVQSCMKKMRELGLLHYETAKGKRKLQLYSVKILH